MSERRSNRRKIGDFQIHLSEKSSRIVTNVKNISTSGVYCQVDTPIPYMKKVMVTLDLPTRKKSTKVISCEGVIVRCDRVMDTDIECYDAAIFFSDLSASVRKAIEEFIDLQE